MLSISMNLLSCLVIIRELFSLPDIYTPDITIRKRTLMLTCELKWDKPNNRLEPSFFVCARLSDKGKSSYFN